MTGVQAPPSRVDVRDWLEAEITEARTEQARGGWTPWGLAAVIAWISWTAIGTWEVGPLDLGLTAKWIVVLSLITDSIVMWTWQIPDFQVPGAWSRRFRIFSDLKGIRVTYSYWTIRGIGLIVLAWVGSTGVAFVPKWVALGFFTFLVGLSILLIVLTFVDVPYQPVQRRALWHTIVGGTVAVLLYIIIIGGYLHTIQFSPPGQGVSELRMAALTAFGTALLYPLLLHARPPSTLQRLVDLRRKMMLGQISDAMAHREVELTVLGMESNVVLEEYLRRTIDHGSQAQS